MLYRVLEFIYAAADLSGVQVIRSERFGQQEVQGGLRNDLPVRVAGQDWNSRSELMDHLAAGAARTTPSFETKHQGRQSGFAFGNGLEDGASLRADGKAVGRVFDIAAGEDFARFGKNGRADSKL